MLCALRKFFYILGGDVLVGSNNKVGSVEIGIFWFGWIGALKVEFSLEYVIMGIFWILCCVIVVIGRVWLCCYMFYIFW